ncbi:contractile injection system tape measure protein [Pandoraea sp. ISTKB]|uniref:contractile injection system tape measure protein n=1 Tax=Pandoraea sp. ISTKB TaxID=1586708 RepID=UPI00084643D2|nr:contractile injection system tape measure protein [Pandoraea sp. ISTKB]ODP32929.1 hypothetical protein A9762_04420 [Pandoraea sp. ISTKB]
MQARHRIRKLDFDLTFASGEMGMSQGEPLRTLVVERLLPVMASVLDDAARDLGIHRIDRLDVDLGEVEAEALPDALAEQLALALAEVLGDGRDGEGAGSPERYERHEGYGRHEEREDVSIAPVPLNANYGADDPTDKPDVPKARRFATQTDADVADLMAFLTHGLAVGDVASDSRDGYPGRHTDTERPARVSDVAASGASDVVALGASTMTGRSVASVTPVGAVASVESSESTSATSGVSSARSTESTVSEVSDDPLGRLLARVLVGGVESVRRQIQASASPEVLIERLTKQFSASNVAAMIRALHPNAASEWLRELDALESLLATAGWRPTLRADAQRVARARLMVAGLGLSGTGAQSMPWHDVWHAVLSRARVNVWPGTNEEATASIRAVLRAATSGRSGALPSPMIDALHRVSQTLGTPGSIAPEATLHHSDRGAHHVAGDPWTPPSDASTDEARATTHRPSSGARAARWKALLAAAFTRGQAEPLYSVWPQLMENHPELLSEALHHYLSVPDLRERVASTFPLSMLEDMLRLLLSRWLTMPTDDLTTPPGTLTSRIPTRSGTEDVAGRDATAALQAAVHLSTTGGEFTGTDALRPETRVEMEMIGGSGADSEKGGAYRENITTNPMASAPVEVTTDTEADTSVVGVGQSSKADDETASMNLTARAHVDVTTDTETDTSVASHSRKADEENASVNPTARAHVEVTTDKKADTSVVSHNGKADAERVTGYAATSMHSEDATDPVAGADSDESALVETDTSDAGITAISESITSEAMTTASGWRRVWSGDVASLVHRATFAEHVSHARTVQTQRVSGDGLDASGTPKIALEAAASATSPDMAISEAQRPRAMDRPRSLFEPERLPGVQRTTAPSPVQVAASAPESATLSSSNDTTDALPLAIDNADATSAPETLPAHERLIRALLSGSPEALFEDWQRWLANESDALSGVWRHYAGYDTVLIRVVQGFPENMLADLATLLDPAASSLWRSLSALSWDVFNEGNSLNPLPGNVSSEHLIGSDHQHLRTASYDVESLPIATAVSTPDVSGARASHRSSSTPSSTSPPIPPSSWSFATWKRIVWHAVFTHLRGGGANASITQLSALVHRSAAAPWQHRLIDQWLSMPVTATPSLRLESQTDRAMESASSEVSSTNSKTRDVAIPGHDDERADASRNDARASTDDALKDALSPSASQGETRLHAIEADSTLDAGNVSVVPDAPETPEMSEMSNSQGALDGSQVPVVSGTQRVSRNRASSIADRSDAPTASSTEALQRLLRLRHEVLPRGGDLTGEMARLTDAQRATLQRELATAHPALTAGAGDLTATDWQAIIDTMIATSDVIPDEHRDVLYRSIAAHAPDDASTPPSAVARYFASVAAALASDSVLELEALSEAASDDAPAFPDDATDTEPQIRAHDAATTPQLPGAFPTSPKTSDQDGPPASAQLASAAAQSKAQTRRTAMPDDFIDYLTSSAFRSAQLPPSGFDIWIRQSVYSGAHVLRPVIALAADDEVLAGRWLDLIPQPLWPGLARLSPRDTPQVATMLRLATDIAEMCATSMQAIAAADLPRMRWLSLFPWLFAPQRPFDSAVFAGSMVTRLARHAGVEAPPALIAQVQQQTGIDMRSSPSNTNEAAAQTPFDVPHAGTVLMSGFLPMLWKFVELTHDGRFVSEAAAERAVLLLYYAGTGQTEAPEHELTMHKLLCGVPFATPVARHLDITEKEAATCDQMIDAMLQHWTALGNTSRAGLREAFLQRDGRLSLAEDGWHLDVRRLTIDVLMRQMPWSISTIQLSWMEQPLWVNWA